MYLSHAVHLCFIASPTVSLYIYFVINVFPLNDFKPHENRGSDCFGFFPLNLVSIPLGIQ